MIKKSNYRFIIELKLSIRFLYETAGDIIGITISPDDLN